MSNIITYLSSLNSNVHPVIKEIEKNNLLGDTMYPIIGRELGSFIYSYILSTKPRKILELGTGCGYCTIFMALAAFKLGTNITSVEIDERKANIAKKNLVKANLSNTVEIIIDDCLNYLPNVEEKFDLIVQDIYPSLYLQTLPYIVEKLNVGKTLFTHDALVACKNAPEQLSIYMNEFNEYLANYKGLSSTIIPLNDGLWYSIKK